MIDLSSLLTCVPISCERPYIILQGLPMLSASPPNPYFYNNTLPPSPPLHYTAALTAPFQEGINLMARQRHVDGCRGPRQTRVPKREKAAN